MLIKWIFLIEFIIIGANRAAGYRLTQGDHCLGVVPTPNEKRNFFSYFKKDIFFCFNVQYENNQPLKQQNNTKKMF